MTVSADSIAFFLSSHFFLLLLLLLLLMGLVWFGFVCTLYVEVYIECVCVCVSVYIFEDGSWVSRFPTIHNRWLWVVFL